MNGLNSLNIEYEKALKDANAIRKCEDNIATVQVDKSISMEHMAIKALKYLLTLTKEVDCSQYPLLTDTITITSQYIKCLYAIDEYKNELLKSRRGLTPAIYNALSAVKQAQVGFDELKKTFFKNYKYDICSIEALNQIIIRAIRKTDESAQKNIGALRNQAIEILKAEYTTELKTTDPLMTDDHLPVELLVARIIQKNAPMAILRDINVGGIYENINIDLKSQGNILISTDLHNANDRRIDEFIVAYILRFIESFPLGSLNVHIFSQNTNFLYKRLNNSFKSENAGEATKKVIQLHNSINDLSVFRDVYCEDIFKKTSVENPDLYAVYNDDKSDPFNLIILRDGLVDGSGYSSSEILDIISSLTMPGEMGHRCGLRFLIVDDSNSFEKNLNEGTKFSINSIEKNCELKIRYDGEGGFLIGNKAAEVLHINGNVDAYVEDRSLMIANAINNKVKDLVSIEDISNKTEKSGVGNILFIPVGKSGASTVELPFSCKDEDGTVAGQCIGYMVIGQSGSGKSSFFHSLVISGCKRYSPKDLQFWLLDFKNGGASSKYSNSGIPHIRIIAENNRIDDALCLFQMILEEMERRTAAFNRCFTDNIIEYNKKALEERLEYFPRIIIAIDEVQEIFREDSASVLQKLISSISTRMRSAGMHFVMVAQNLSEGKSYMLKDAFMPSATGRICFRVAPDIPRDSSFGDDFIQRKQEISDLKTGEAYVSYGRNTIKKVKMAYVSTEDMSEREFVDIRNKYPEYSNMRPMIIGSKARLSIISLKQNESGNYKDEIIGLKAKNGIYDAVIGEDVYRMSPFHVHFTQNENSSLLLLGSDKQMSSSLCTSIAISLLRQKAQIHLFNADRTRVSTDGFDSIPHPFMFFCQNIPSVASNIKNHRLDHLKDVLREMYAEYFKRQAIVQGSEDEAPSFGAIVLIINDLFGIESFCNNEIIEGQVNESKVDNIGRDDNPFNFSLFSDQEPVSSKNSEQFRESTQNIITILLKNGYRYNLHLVLSIKGDPSTWRTGRSFTSINKTILFNDTEYAEHFENSYYLKEMLKNIANESDEETVAVWAGRKSFSKIRPIIYKISNPMEKDALVSLINE